MGAEKCDPPMLSLDLKGLLRDDAPRTEAVTTTQPHGPTPDSQTALSPETAYRAEDCSWQVLLLFAVTQADAPR